MTDGKVLSKPSRKPKTYKKLLSIFEIDDLAKEHAASPIFVVNARGERVLELWLKALRINQAFQVAETILGKPIDEQEFQNCWARTPSPQKKPKDVAEPPNTATFGGYRLGGRSALNRDKKQKPRPKKK
jgi:hypothetical protein